MTEKNNELTRKNSLLLNDYLAYLISERGLSDNTIQSYRRDLTFFLCICQREKIDHVHSMSQQALNLIITTMAQDLSKRSLNRRISAIRGFFKFLHAEMGEGDTDIHLALSKAEDTLPDVLTIAEVDLLISAPDEKSKNGARDRAILELLYATGMRVSELTSLKIDQLFLDDEYVRVIGKGNKERIVPIGKKAQDAVRNYLSIARPAVKMAHHTPYLFLNNRGQGLSRQTVWRMMQKYAHQTHLDEHKQIYPHILRHSFASHMLAKGAHLRLIQELLGHATISTTQVYTHLLRDDVLHIYHEAHPRS